MQDWLIIIISSLLGNGGFFTLIIIELIKKKNNKEKILNKISNKKVVLPFKYIPYQFSQFLKENKLKHKIITNRLILVEYKDTKNKTIAEALITYNQKDIERFKSCKEFWEDILIDELWLK